MQIITDSLQKEKKEHGNFSFPILVSHERLLGYETGAFLWHWHPEIELTYVVSGEMLYSINDEVHHIKQGDILFGNQSTLHEGKQWEQSDCEYIAVTFLPKLLYGFEGSLLQEQYIKPITEQSGIASLHLDGSEDWYKDIRALLLATIDCYEGHSQGSEFDVIANMLRLWKMLYYHIEGTGKTGAGNRRNFERIRHMVSYIEQHYSEHLTLDDIANASHLSRSECSRVFKKAMGTSLFSFIQNYRIEKSVAYLLESDAPITEIAEMVGFSDGNYYTKAFRQVMHTTPTAYRKQNG